MGAILLNPIATPANLGVACYLRNINAVQASTPPLVLIFGPFDPTGASSLPADAVTCANLGCHALSALTAIRVQDTAHIDEIQPISPESLDDQARCLLEDMAIKAIKVGQVYTTETVSMIAQIAADYNHVPLILHLLPLPDDSLLDDVTAEELQSAILELLLPLTDIVIIDHNLLLQWQAEDVLPTEDALTPGQSLLQYGTQWVLSCGAPLATGQLVYLLEGQSQLTSSWPWQPPPARLQDTEGPMSCALMAQLAHGNITMPQAAQAAVAQTTTLLARSFQPGMGQRLINRSPA
ncbi:bifunctional hydroxymethylpyrimidine kinase/phosphomethylpyrimidine kinase [Alcaligenaceae bacterium]|nr:bifunctional hydroxymethylpyrimidine kinase/phosphomethylpyrimidine kinase [Alcaligenaceae bacterium]